MGLPNAADAAVIPNPAPPPRRVPRAAEPKAARPPLAKSGPSITQRIDAITRIAPAYRSATPSAPKSVKIELTARCDMKCFFCATGQRMREKSDMSWDFFTRIAREMREAGVEELGLFYLGESFLCEWLPDAIRYAKKECGYPYLFLTTNGRLATPERVDACMKAGLGSLKFSFNNADPQQFEEVTGLRGRDHHKVIANIKAARAVRDAGEYDCGVYASSIQYDGEQLTRMKKAVAEIRPFVDEHYWLPLYGQAGLTSGARGTRPTAGNQGRIGALRPALPCWALFTEGHITFDGHLAACCFDHDGRFNMGDLNEQSFLEAWGGERFQALRQANLDADVSGTVCQECLAYR